MDTAQLKKKYKEEIAPALQKQFNYTSAMQIPVLEKIVINEGLGGATQDKKIIDVAVNELTAITGQKAVATTHWVLTSRSSSLRSTSIRWTASRV